MSWTDEDEESEREHAEEQMRIGTEKKEKKWTTDTVRKELKEKDKLWFGDVINCYQSNNTPIYGVYSQKFKDLKAELEHELNNDYFSGFSWKDHDDFMYTFCKDQCREGRININVEKAEGECLRVLKQLADAVDKYNLKNYGRYKNRYFLPNDPDRKSKLDALEKKVNDSKPKITQKMRREYLASLARLK